MLIFAALCTRQGSLLAALNPTKYSAKEVWFFFFWIVYCMFTIDLREFLFLPEGSRGRMWFYRVLREAPGASGWWDLAPGPGRAQCWTERLGGETWPKCSVLQTPTRASVKAKFAAKSKEKLLDRDTQRRSLADSRLPDLANQLVILLVNSKSSFGNKEVKKSEAETNWHCKSFKYLRACAWIRENTQG